MIGLLATPVGKLLFVLGVLRLLIYGGLAYTLLLALFFLCHLPRALQERRHARARHRALLEALKNQKPPPHPYR